MDQDIKRLLMRYEQLLRETNHAIINPQISELSIDGLRPIAELVARSRASYLKSLCDVAEQYQGTENLPTDEEMAELKKLRKRYLDLVDGSQSIEIAIERGYLDVKE